MSRFIVPFIPPELDDDVILATDEEGEELLRFATRWSGKTVLLRFPSKRMWDQYIQEVMDVLRLLGYDTALMEFPVLTGLINVNDINDWTRLNAALISEKAVADRFIELFIKFLRPEIEGMDVEASAEWIRENTPLDGAARALIALLSPEDCLKKNIHYGLTLLYRRWMGQRTTPTVTKNGDGRVNTPTIVPSSLAASFY